MHYLYVIRSLSDQKQTYAGATADLKQRIADNNAGKSAHASKFVPWELEFYVALPEKLGAAL